MAAITHIGLTVSDLNAAVNFYKEVLGFRIIAGPFDMKPEAGDMTQDLQGEQVKHIRNVHMSAANQVGIELFEFIEPKTNGKTERHPWDPGMFHLCVVAEDGDVHRLAKKIEKTGGKVISQFWPLNEDSNYYLVYCQDPFGNIIEVYSHSTEQIFANR
ncbi:Catechol 2,3-dioxygenase [Terribacillus aidingensis]|uniref:Catechol 2,3-dioxygenase n=1 Tax=Terribacillus aidingensis TaxID=586416 RepID=A0A285P3P3_9BACI|nr:VOC family protein [Terribacillus aidingensis]SNZ15783.1 Catechol 2,3-dioxygenase [Terribacillus aidingensis]